MFGGAYFRNFAVFRSIYNLIIFNLLRYTVKRSKELSKLQCFWDFYILVVTRIGTSGVELK